MNAVPFDLPRRLTAEALGTAFLLATVVGSGIMAERLADGNVALALLANSIPAGAMLVVLITMLGPISGAHSNPAVTLSFVMQRAIGTPEAVAYVGAQLAGAAIGTWCAHLMFELPILMSSGTARSGIGQWTGEAVATFGLVATILACVRFRPKAVAAAVGLYITAAYWFTSSTSFANPAVTFARTLTDSFAGIRPATPRTSWRLSWSAPSSQPGCSAGSWFRPSPQSRRKRPGSSASGPDRVGRAVALFRA